MDGLKKVVMLGDSLTQSGGIATLENLILKYASPDVEIQHIASHDQGSIIYRGFVFVKALGLLVWRLLRKETHLVHIHISDGGSILRKSIIAAIALLFHKPVLMHAHGSVFHINYAKLPKWAQQSIARIFSQCQGWIALTSFWKDFYISHLGLDQKRVFILLNPTELPKELPNRINSFKIKLVFLGRVGQRKGTFDLINAFANLPGNLKSNSELMIAGDGEVHQGRQLVEQLNLAEHIKFLGLINAQERDLLLTAADIYVLPTYNEGLPLALLEAMSWGLPVITTPVSGIPDVVSNQNGLLVTPGNIQQLSEAIQLLMENEDLRLSLGLAARETVASLDVKFYWGHLAEIYDSVLAANHSFTIKDKLYK